MLRIALVTDHPEHEDKVDGGVQAVTKYLIGALVQSRDLELHVVSFRYGIHDEQQIDADGYVRHILPGAPLGTLTGFWKDQRILDKCLKSVSPDVVHAQGAGHNGIVAMRSNYPTVVTIHEIMTREAGYYSGFTNRARHRLLSMLSERHCIRRAKHTILISPYVSEYFGDRLSGTKHLIANPIADSFFNLARQDDTNRVLFAGRLIPRKGVMDLIHATSMVPRSLSMQLILAGSMDDQHYVDQLRSEAESLGVSDIVEFRGLLNDEEYREEMSRCALLVLPSYQETAPMVIAEAMAAGVPVVATDVGGVRYQIKDSENGFLVNPGDVPALAEKLGVLLGDSELRESFGKSAKTSATEQYRASSVAARTVEVYRGILAEQGVSEN